MYIIKRVDFNVDMFYTQSVNQEIDYHDDEWTDNINFAKIYIGKAQATGQKNILIHGVEWRRKPISKHNVDVVEVGLKEL